VHMRMLRWVLAGAALGACGEGAKGAAQVPAIEAVSVPVATPTKPGGAATFRCSDLITRADAAQLGLDVSRYDDQVQQARADQGLYCDLGGVRGSLVPASAFDLLLKARDTAIASHAQAAAEGPKLAEACMWSTGGGEVSVLFRNGRAAYGATFRGADRAYVEAVSKHVASSRALR
jgi:hypothetical protein